MKQVSLIVHPLVLYTYGYVVRRLVIIIIIIITYPSRHCGDSQMIRKLERIHIQYRAIGSDKEVAECVSVFVDHLFESLP